MNFRRWITALAVLALFAGFASAQVSFTGASGGGVFSCSATVSAPPVLRVEGFTELVGDIVLTCTGGTTPAIGAQLATANITVSFVTNVTSRLLAYNLATPNSAIAANTSEALLLIDEPGSGEPGVCGGPGLTNCPPPGNFGPNAPQTLCTQNNAGAAVASAYGAGGTPGAGGCTEYVQQLASNGDFVMSSTASTVTTPVPGANVFAGVVNAGQVTFYGIPMMPPASQGVARIFRMTNIRINASQLGVGPYAGTSQAVASVSISNGVPIYTPVQIAGFIQTGLSTSIRATTSGSFTVPNFAQCQSQSSPTADGTLRFTENFGTAFKTRVSPTTSTNGQSSYPTSPNQNVPGFLYNSESGFIFSNAALNGTGTYGSTAGLADYGTRLKAVFSNVPSGVRIFVSTTNVVNLTGVSGTGGVTQPAGTSTTSFAQLITSDLQIDNNGSAPTVPISGYIYSGVSQVTPYAEIIPVNGTATAVWEVINANASAAENFDFGVFTQYTAATATNSPPVGTATVTMSYAPTPSSTGGVTFTTTTGPAASSTLLLPRFADPTATPPNFFNVIQCTTSLLFPFITNQAGFDTGIAIMNTTQDPFSTKLQSGICNLWFYGQNVPATNPYVTATIAAGSQDPTKYAWLASVISPSFEGYMIAVCNFQMAHGYAFVSDLGAKNLAHGYLALIFNPNPTATARSNANPEILEN